MIRSIIVIVSILAVCTLACGQIVVPCVPGHNYSVDELRSMLPEGRIEFTQAEVTPVVDELMPLVERAAGRQFTHRPKVKIVNRNTLMAAIYADRLREFCLLDPVASKAQTEAQWQIPALAYAAPRSITAIARYIDRDETILIVPTNRNTTARFLRAFDATTTDLLRAVLAHELVRALQSQHGLGTPNGDDIEAMYVGMNLAEAHAWVVGEAALRMLPDAGPSLEARSVLSVPPLESDDPRVNGYLINENYVLEAFRSKDVPFMQKRYEALGPEGCWIVLEKRPERWLDPAVAAAWVPAERSWPGIRALFEPVKTTLGDRLPRRQSEAQETGAIAHTMEETLGPIRAPEGIARVVRFATLIAVEDTNSQALGCTVMEVLHDQDADWAQEFLRDQEKELQTMLKDGGFEVRTDGPVPLDLKNADWAERSTCTAVHGDRTAESTRWRARRGRILIDVSATQSPLTDDEAVAMLQSMIDACAIQTKQAVPAHSP